MPELPEVETIRRTLAAHVGGLVIRQVHVFWPPALSGWEGREMADIVQGQKIASLGRRGKYLLIHLQREWTLVAHMRMTGRLYYFPEAHAANKHTHAVFELDRGELHFMDTRKFGRIQAVPNAWLGEVPALRRLGPEPLDESFTPEVLGQRLHAKKVKLKAALLDQAVIAGLGNIYADEALFAAGLHPEKPAAALNGTELVKLHGAIQSVLQAGIDSRGTSFRDYRDANGEMGSFQARLNVYGRAGEPCRKCGRALAKLRLGGRTTVFCPECQR